MSLVTASIQSFHNFDYEELSQSFEARKQQVLNAGVKIEVDMNFKGCEKVAMKFLNAVVMNLEARFSDDISKLAEFHTVLQNRTETPTDSFIALARLLHLNVSELMAEWKILRRVDGELSSRTVMLNIATSAEKKAMFPVMSRAMEILLLLPLGTATVERSFSTMNRILCSERCRLHPEHVRQLMLLSIEGPQVIDVRDGKEEELSILNKLIDEAHIAWLKKPRRA